MVATTQRCPRCCRYRPREDYHPDKWGKVGHYCRECVLDYRREWRRWSKGQRTRAEHFEAIRRRCDEPGCDVSPSSKSAKYCAAHKPLPSESYRAVHKRIEKIRDKASVYTCTHCVAQAEHWAYDHGDLAEVIGSTDRGLTVAYSLNPDHYLPLCRSCHVKFDNGGRMACTSTPQPKRVSNW